MVEENHSRELLALVARGSDSAAAAVFDRYVLRLTRLARGRLSVALSRRVDPDDIVLSAYRSFFVAARQGRFTLERSGDLWRLLAQITLHKLYRQARGAQAQKRAMSAESRGQLERQEVVAVEPSPEEAVALAEELEATLRELDSLTRTVIEMRLQAHSLEEIAQAIGRSERTVRRTLASVAARLRQRLLES